MTTWLSIARAEISQRDNLNDDIITVLRAFGKDDNDAPGPANLDPDCIFVGNDDEPLDVEQDDAISYLQQKISVELLDEIDVDQANMFGRRFSSVSSLLKTEKEKDVVSTEQLLRLALHRRTIQILSTTDATLSKRKALRIRALVDFIWSQSLVLGLADSSDAQSHPMLSELIQKYELYTASSSHYNQFAPGFYHATLEGITNDYGPVHINILRINLHQSKCQMKCLDARETCTDLAALAKAKGAMAAISGGFFLYSEPDIVAPSKRTDPVGLLVSDGTVYLPPVFNRAAVLQMSNESDDDKSSGMIDLGRIGMVGVTCTLNLTTGSNMQTIELTIDQKTVKCTHRGDAEELIISENEIGIAIVGSKVVAISITQLSVPLAGYVLSFQQNKLPPGCKLNENDTSITVEYKLPLSINDAMAGGPLFFSEKDNDGNHNSMQMSLEDFRGSAPPVTFSQDETFDRNLLPRMGVGITKNGEELCCVAVDGRNLDRALGLTLQGTSDLLRSLGCTKAMNLDGGSSKRMVILDPKSGEHKVVCLSTTEIKADSSGSKSVPSRPVHSAILFLPP